MKNYLLHIEKNIKESLIKLEKNSEKCLIIVDSKNILKGTLTDGECSFCAFSVFWHTDRDSINRGFET